MCRVARTLAVLCAVIYLGGAVVSAQAVADRRDVARQEEKQKSKKKTKAVVAVFPLYEPISEAPLPDDPLMGNVGVESLKDLVSRLNTAGEDDDVQAVAVILGGGAMGMAQLEEVHTALVKIRDQGKPVYMYADSLSFGTLALASAASRVSVAPVGDIMALGLYGEQLHLRGMLDKIHVTPDFQTCGAYKSASELFMRKKPSPQAEEMYNWLFDSLFQSCVSMIADGRGKSVDEVKRWIDDGVYTAQEAVGLGIIDAAEFRSDFVGFLEKRCGKNVKLDTQYAAKKQGEIDLANPFAFMKIWAEILSESGTSSDEDSVAIVYVNGAIVPGRPDPGPFGSQGMAYSDPIRKALNKAAEDDSVKAVVLRVDSPGGSAVASEIILQATREVAAKKPFVVSMGNVAGSGGYYVSCGADTIFADKTTITASIGVVAGKLATREMWDSLGVGWHPIGRGKNSGMFLSGDTFSKEQSQMLQDYMDDIYRVFKGHVTTARGDRLKKPIDELAGGRVFTGQQALELGLVDRLGTLEDAVRFVAEKADLDDDEYELRVIPKPKNFMEQIIEELSGQKEDEGLIQTGGSSRWHTADLWKQVSPLLNSWQPQRAQALRRALIQLEILERESLSLMTPEFVFSP